MNPTPLSFRIRILVLAIVAIAWLAMTHDRSNELDVQPGATTAKASEVVVAGKAVSEQSR